MAVAVACIAFTAVVKGARAPDIPLYVPDPASHGMPQDHGLKDMKAVKVRTADGLEVEAWFQPPPQGGKVIVFFPGNAGNLASRAGFAAFYTKYGYGLYMCEYPGYGGNPGKPSEQSLYAAGRAGMAWLAEQGYKPADLILLGESIGSGVAVQLALETPPAFMVLESGFTSVSDVMKYRYPEFPVEKMFNDNKFDNLEKIARIKTHTLFIHGEKDTLIPISFGQKLFEAANEPKEFMIIKGSDHNDIYMYGAGEMLMAWLDKQVKAK